MRILVLEPYYGGSHRAVLDGLLARLGFEYDLLTLPARKWKWRMRGAAITMSDRTRRLHESGTRWDLIYASTFLNLAEFRGLTGAAVADVPAIIYFHENQLVYPVRHEAEWDYQFPLTNITSALSAELCLFNTRWNLERFVKEIPSFIKAFPDHHPVGIAERIAAKSRVLAPPFDPAAFDAAPVTRGERVRIVWPHRWEHDKDPETFFSAVEMLAREGLDFEVAVAGQSFRETEALMAEATSMLGDRLVHLGEPEDRDAYARLLARADVAVSTAANEFFGLAMIEACYAGCYPLVPDALAYPEIYPLEYRYNGKEQLVARLRGLIEHRPEPGQGRALAEPFTFDRLAAEYARVFEKVAAGA
jgi:glycosyltransferase involved in cell wall biosynthesis